ncbi:MAG: hypothetical protein RIQ93_1506 [Verrucomicrobiota bacterium]|jgi:mono/diheme cytochrome c family protein
MKLWCCGFFITVLTSAWAGSYRLEEVTLVPGMSPEISGLSFSPSGRLVVTNRHGEVWTCDPAKRDWLLFAFGLHEPMGVLAISDREIYVSQRPELTRLVDANGDGKADDYMTVSDDWGITDNWHEFTFGLYQDAEGNFVVSMGLPDTAGPLNTLNPRLPLDTAKVYKEAKPSVGPWQGWVLKITPQGEIIPWGSGFRCPEGVGLSPDGEIFVTDQQGDYIASSPLVHVKRGHFYGHPASLKWAPGWKNKQPTPAELEALRTPPAVVLPHGSMGGSPGEPVWDTSQGKFGPFGGQVFVGDFVKLISRVDLEKVGGEYQGACFPFLRDGVGAEDIARSNGGNFLTIPAGGEGKKYFRDVAPLEGTRLRQGNNRLRFAPDGSLYVGQTARGWSVGDGLQRIVWNDETPVEILTMRLTERGFALTFTTPMDRAKLRDKRSYRMERFRYLYNQAYGSARVDASDVALADIKVSDDGRRAELIFSEPDPGFIYALALENLVSTTGQPVENPEAYYTVNRTLSGRQFTGPLGAALTPPEPELKNAGPVANVKNGQKVYLTYCAPCHQPTGTGGGLPGLTAADFTADNSPLRKPDAELLQTISRGVEGKGMPPFGDSLAEKDRRDALAYIRATFGKKK